MNTIFCLWLAIALVITVEADAHPRHIKPHCSDHCGEVEIPYPFGVERGCYLNEIFRIECNKSSELHQPLMGNIRLMNISVEKSQMQVWMPIARDCYKNNSDQEWNGITVSLKGTSFTISNRNRFTAIGCDIDARLYGILDNENYMFGCMSVCNSIKQVEDGSCSGVGCCQTAIPKGMTITKFNVTSFQRNAKAWDFNPCGYALLVDKDNFNFSTTYLSNFSLDEVLLVMDWTIGNETCKSAQKKSQYACKENSYCINAEDGSGYRCKCLEGFQGNAYLPGGCQDIDECSKQELHNCSQQCHNTVGNYTCSCYQDFRGDGRKDGEGCTQLPVMIRDKSAVVNIIVAAGVSFIVVTVVGSWVYLVLRRRKLIILKEEFFKKNGGLILQQQISPQGSNASFKIFSATELKNATKNYHESMVVGRGGFGTVYKGLLSDSRTVAIKKSKTVEVTEIEQFINEVIVLSQINHRNIVKLLGCCLETRVPLLVYEYVSNGTLFSYIHNQSKESNVSWDTRLRIASETANAVSYLHFATSTPVIHRDIKSSNILLDENYTAKVSDFGASRFIPIDQTELATVVQGTLGYLDPEYLQTSQLTEKSDVYSFGVVLVELLTGKLPLSFDRQKEHICLAMVFLYYLNEGKLFQVVETDWVEEDNIEQINKVAELAKRCLNVKGKERPTMKEVAIELEDILVKTQKQHGLINIELTSETTKDLNMGETSKTCARGDNSPSGTDYDSMKNDPVFPISDGR